MSFRFSLHTATLLDRLSTRFRRNKTEMLEKALHLYAKKQLKNEYEVLSYAGCIPSNDMEEVMDIIIKSRSKRARKVSL